MYAVTVKSAAGRWAVFNRHEELKNAIRTKELLLNAGYKPTEIKISKNKQKITTK